jgi:hypothetical protein
MSTLFRDARLKIDRANKHVADIKAIILSLEKTYTVTVEENAKTGFQDLIHAIPKFEDRMLDLSLILGDAVHNLHAALDFAWVSTIERIGPSILDARPKFPVYPIKEELKGALKKRKVDIASPALFDLIMSNIQPYERGQSGVTYVLHALDISDKHLLLLELKPNVGIKGIVIQDKDGEILHGGGTPVQGSGPYVIPFDKDIKIENKGHLSVEVTIKEAGIFHGLSVLDLLSHFSQYVFYVVELLENL